MIEVAFDTPMQDLLQHLEFLCEHSCVFFSFLDEQSNKYISLDIILRVHLSHPQHPSRVLVHLQYDK